MLVGLGHAGRQPGDVAIKPGAQAQRHGGAVIVPEADLLLAFVDVAQAHALGGAAGLGIDRVRARHAVVDEVLKRLGRELSVD